MKQKSKSNEIDINEIAINVEVDSEVIGKVRNGDIRQLELDSKEDELNLETLRYIVLIDGDDHCLTRILEVELDEPNDGESLWKVRFNIVPVLESPRKFLMRWNPSISSFKESDYEECLANMQCGIFRMNWSIYEWEEARIGDVFYMLRIGDDKAGIVFNGMLVSNPYVLDDWAESSKRKLYVDMACMNPVEPGEKPEYSLEMLKTAIPEYNWGKGHSGVLLPDGIAEKLMALWNNEVTPSNQWLN